MVLAAAAGLVARLGLTKTARVALVAAELASGSLC